MVFLHALGQCLIRTGIGTIGPRAELGFAMATRLIADRGRRFTRRHLTALFWPDVEEQKAAHSLSEALHRLRVRGVPIETDATQAVWIDRDAVTLDVERIPDMHPAELAKCDFTVLPGFEPRGAPALRDWADEYRHQLTIQTLRNLAPAIARAEREGDWTSALTLAEHALKLDAEDPAALLGRATAAAKLSERRHAFEIPARPSNDQRDVTPAKTPDVVRESSPVSCELRERTSATHSGKFVGREAELEVLRDALESAKRGRGRRILIYGQSGIGKTRLVRQFRGMVRLCGGVSAEIQSDPADASRPLSAFLRLVPALRALPGAAAISPELRPYLDRLTELDGASSQWPDPADTPYMLACIERAVDELIDSIADEQPLVVVVDNAQWADVDSRRLLDALTLTSAARAVLVMEVTCETDEPPPSSACPSTIPIHVLPLPDDSARTLVLDRIQRAGRDGDEALVRWLVSAGAGVPLHLEEISEYWIHGGRAFDLPPTFSAVLKERIASLSSEERHVLHTVALLGQQATIARVQRVAGLDHRAFISALDALGTAGFVDLEDRTQPADDATREQRLRCRHHAVAHAATADLSDAGRAALHRAIALELERDAPSSANVLWDRISHWNDVNDPTDAVRATIACARHLASLGLAAAGVNACRHLLHLPLADHARRDVLVALTHTLHHAWQWSGVLETVDQLRRLAPEAREHDDIELCALDARWQLQHDRAQTLADSIRCASAEEASAAHRVQAAAIAMKLATNAGSREKLHETFFAVSQTLDAPGVDPADRTSVAMMYHAVGGSLPAAARAARELIVMSSSMAQPARLRALINSASALARADHRMEALAICDEVACDALKYRLVSIAAAACHRAANIALDSGEIESARLWTARFEAHAAPDDLRRMKAVALARARIAYHDGDFGEAGRLLAFAGFPLWSDATSAFATTSLATAIAVEAEAGRSEVRLRSMLAATLLPHRRLQAMGAHDFVACALGVGYARIGDAVRAEALIASYLTTHRREQSPLPEVFAAMLDRAGLRGPVTG